MRIVRSTDVKWVPASHEDPHSPGVFRKILLKRDDLIEGFVQMINWALLPAGGSFRAHFHEDMQEIFVMVKGNAKIRVDKEAAVLRQGDAVVIPAGGVHKMENIGSEDVEYVVIGISERKGGATVLV